MPTSPVQARPFGGGQPIEMGGFHPPDQGMRPLLGSFKKGGKVKKTGNYKLHKGERVISLKKAMKGK